MRAEIVAAACLGLTAYSALAEREPQPREDAHAVIVGTIKKITTKESKFGEDGTRTDYVAEVEVTKAEKGDAKAGETIKVRWYDVTKRPSKIFPAAYGHDYKLKKDDEAKFWLMGDAKKGYTVIYNRQGVEKLKKE